MSNETSICALTRKPCPSCPWVVANDARDIPNFSLALAEGLANTCTDSRGFGPQFGAPIFSCHQSRPHEEFPCAGWLAVEGAAHPGARMLAIAGKILGEALSPGPDWPELEPDFKSLIEKLRATA